MKYMSMRNPSQMWWMQEELRPLNRLIGTATTVEAHRLPRNPGLSGPYQKAAPDAPPFTWLFAFEATFLTAFCAFLTGRGFFAASTTVLICRYKKGL